MKKSTRKRYSTGKRVSYAQGDPVYKIDDGDKNNGGDDDNGGGDDNGIIDDTLPAKGQMSGITTASQERTDRIAETAEETTRRAQGQMPEKTKIPAAEKVGFEMTSYGTVKTDSAGNPIRIPSQQTTTMAEPTEAKAEEAQAVTPEAVSTVETVDEGIVANQLTANTFDAITKNQPAIVEKAIRNISPELRIDITAQVQEIAKSNPTEAAKIAQQRITESLTPEVVGELRPISSVPYLEPKTAIEVEDVQKAKAETRTAQQIEADEKANILGKVTGEGVNLEDIPSYELAKTRTAQVAEANTKIAQDLGTASCKLACCSLLKFCEALACKALAFDCAIGKAL